MGLGIKQVSSVEDVSLLVGKTIVGYLPPGWSDPDPTFPTTHSVGNAPFVHFNKGAVNIGVGDYSYSVSPASYTVPCTGLTYTGDVLTVGGELIVTQNASVPVFSSDVAKVPVMASTRNSAVQPGVSNTVVLGGTGIIACVDDTAYAQQVHLEPLPSNLPSPTSTGMLYSVNGVLYWDGLPVNSLTSCTLGPVPTGWVSAWCDDTSTAYYGHGASGGPSGLVAGMSCAEAFDRIETTVAKAVPEAPPLLSTRTAVMMSASAAGRSSTTGALHASVTLDVTPQFSVAAVYQGVATPPLTGFYNGAGGTLEADVYDGATLVTPTLSIAVDCDTAASLPVIDSDPASGVLTIADIQDYHYPEPPPVGGWWLEISDASLQVNHAYSPSLTQHSVVFRHIGDVTSETTADFYVDTLPGSQSVTVTPTDFYPSPSNAARVLSGVPLMKAGDVVMADYSVQNAVSYHFAEDVFSEVREASGQCAASQVKCSVSGIGYGVGTATVTSVSPSTLPYSYGQTVTIVGQEVVVEDGVFALGDHYSGFEFEVQSWAFDSSTASVTSITGTGLMADSVSNDTDHTNRVTSGSGRYPSALGANWGYAWDDSVLLTTGNLSIAHEYELQYCNGRYAWPLAHDYTLNSPAGPDYSSIGSIYDAYGTMRWATFYVTYSDGASGIYVRLDGASGSFVGVELLLRVVGETGWLDASSPYTYGTPVSDGDAAMLSGFSTDDTKRVTFGTTPRTGAVYIRVGIPAGSSFSFTGVSWSLDGLTYEVSVS